MAKFDFSPLLASDAPAAAGRWAGFPEHNFIGGHVGRETIPVEALVESMTRQLRALGPELATYNLEGGKQGMLSARQVVVDKLARDRGTDCSVDDVLMLSGSLQGFELVNNALLNPGDYVVIEENTYGGILTSVARRGAKIVGAPLDDDGILVDKLAIKLDRLADQGIVPKYIYTIPTIQNPTGSMLPLDRRLALLELARDRGIAIFEDECYADLVWDEDDWPAALRGLDDSGLVIHLGSFSKSLAPAIRLGYLVADWPILSQLMALKTDAGTGALEQMLVADYFGSHFEAHLTAAKPVLKAKLDVMMDAINAQFGTAAEFTEPKGGIFFWMRIPGVDTSKLLPACTAEGLEFTPGAAWSTDDADPSARECLRLCFALPSHQEIRDGVAKLAEICHRETGIPVRSGNVDRT
ncbi:MAG: PLP-dependent aminotransferase family protein [Pseudomonadota bacterium]